MTDASKIMSWLGHRARELKLVSVGIAPAGPIGRVDAYHRWLALGRAGSMRYMHEHQVCRADPRELLPGARSIIVVADSYRQTADGEKEAYGQDGSGQRSYEVANVKGTVPLSPDSEFFPHTEVPKRSEDHPRVEDAGRSGDSPCGRPCGRVARYAWGRDYHRVLKKKLHRLADGLGDVVDEPFETRVCVDTAPLIEREVAAMAGIGWIGKNTLVLNQEAGSYFFLGEILTTLDLPVSSPVTDHCGSCTRCLDACPTGAFPKPYEMDASRCISYLTIEHRDEEIAEDLRPLMGDWIFGCDICQEVCPYNRKVPPTPETDYLPSKRFPLAPHPSLEELINLDDETYDRALRGSAMRRATRKMLQRNARIALANQRRKNDDRRNPNDEE